MNDGASALILASAEAIKKHNLSPIAKILSFADSAHAPEWFTTAPTKAAPKALKIAKMTTDDHELPEYWIDKVQSPFTSDVTSFRKDDIEPEKKLKLEHAKTIVSDRYGKRSKNISDENFLKLVTEKNDRIWKRVFAEAGPLVTSIFVL